MKKSLFFLLFLMTSLLSKAQSWTEPSESAYPNETPVYVQVKVNGVLAQYTNRYTEIAAFVEGDETCRAYGVVSGTAFSKNYNFSKSMFTLRVRGNDADMSKNVIFKVRYEGVVYRLKKTIVFDGETYPTIPLELNVDALSSVSLPATLNLEGELPYEYDLTDDLKFVYKADDYSGPAYQNYEVEPTGESEIEGATASWSYDANPLFSIDNSTNVLQITSEVTKVPIQYIIKDAAGNNLKIAETTLFFKEAEKKITSITYTGADPLVCEIGDDVFEMIRAGIQILPTDATNKNVDIQVKDVVTTNPFPGGIANEAGTFVLEVTAADGSGVSTTVNVKVNEPIVLSFPTKLDASKYYETELNVTFVSGEGFDPSEVNVWADDNEALSITGEGLNWKVVAKKVGMQYFYVSYKGVQVSVPSAEGPYNVDYGMCIVPVEVKLPESGWDWISAPATEIGFSIVNADDGSYLAQLNKDANNQVIDLRSQTDLLFNDKKLGLFGTIESLSLADGMYKVKAQYADSKTSIIRTEETSWETSALANKTIKTGYTWIAYPNEFDLAIDLYNDIVADNTVSEGDMIIGKDGFAEYDGADWVGTDGFTLKSGKGYIYYTESSTADPAFLSCMAPEGASARARAAKKESHWLYDASQFADNMAIVAELAGLADAENYTVGAFVNGECRGEGCIVKGAKAMISVAGKAGDKVTFRLYDKATGEEFTVNETVNYAQKAGSLSAPISLTSPGAITGIANVATEANGAAEVYNLNGQRVDGNTKGIVIIKQNGVSRKVMMK